MIVNNIEKSFNKMIKYCAKDVSDTKKIWKHCEKHVAPKLKSNYNKEECPNCGSKHTHKHDKRVLVSGTYQRHMCQSCGKARV